MSSRQVVSIGPTRMRLPSHWKLVSISRAYKINPAAFEPNPSKGGTFDYIDISSIVDGRIEDVQTIPAEDAPSRARRLVKAGDVLVSTVRPYLKAFAYVKEKDDGNVCSTGFAVLRARKGSSGEYMYHTAFSEYFVNQMIRRMTGTSYPAVSLRDFRTIDIILPPLPEQKRIAEILSTVDEAIQKTDEVIEAATRLKRGLMQELLTRGIGHTEFKEVRIGPRSLEIPATWTVRRVGGTDGLCRVVTGGTPRTTVDRYWNGDIHWVVPTDITNNDGIYISSSGRMITAEGLNSSSATLMEPGAILLTTRATIGEACINTVPMATNQGFKSLVCGKDVDNLFLYYMIQREKKRLASLGGGSTFDEVSKSDVCGFEIPTPPIEEQKRISEILHSVDQFVYAESDYTSALQKLKKGLMQDLLTGTVRVKTDAG